MKATEAGKPLGLGSSEGLGHNAKKAPLVEWAEHLDDLYWHALNYRTAATTHAKAMWQELLSCVERKVAAERERCAKLCEDLRDKHVDGTRAATNPGDWCAEDGIDCEFVVAWNDAAAAIRGGPSCMCKGQGGEGLPRRVGARLRPGQQPGPCADRVPRRLECLLCGGKAGPGLAPEIDIND